MREHRETGRWMGKGKKKSETFFFPEQKILSRKSVECDVASV